MVKLTFCLRRRPDLDQEEFERYWREVHAPLVVHHAAALGILRYVQSRALGSSLDASLRRADDAPEPFDGIAEIWLESEQALRDAMQTPAGREAGKALLEDERRFIDFARSPIWISAEHEVMPLA